eukprot:TRINITY_DN2687_c0_g3_i5.p1 TRINITY_DN2687_c0_g3~~TRINITY_DN2687_c0_g3_i5.p1  ORF type:complete len:397 (-),score=63.73 TRINITY_DN2687_c0_g3_i5:257-1447(-)
MHQRLSSFLPVVLYYPLVLELLCRYFYIILYLEKRRKRNPSLSFSLEWQCPLQYVSSRLPLTSEAFPVLVRILADLKIVHSVVGVTTISAAALEDVLSWCILAILTATVTAGKIINVLYIFLSLIAWSCLLLLPVRWGFNRMLQKGGDVWGGIFAKTFDLVSGPPSEFLIFLAVGLCVLSAFFTDMIGIHSMFGAFLAGLSIPRQNDFPVKIIHRIEDLVHTLFLPLYFAFSGLRTNIGLLNDGMAWLGVFLVILTASTGKILGAFGASRFTGRFTFRESLAIGILMNTKGLVELIVLNFGLDFGILNTKLFTVMVIMAIFTTLMTSPLVQIVCPQIQTQGLEEYDFSSPMENFENFEELLVDLDAERKAKRSSEGMHEEDYMLDSALHGYKYSSI